MAPNSDEETFVPTLSSLDNYLAKERSDRRVLSIQSHVVSGFVGNKCAVFPLQLHGFEVDSVNSVQFSNHTQYVNGARGQRLNQQDLELLVEGLRVNRLDRNYSHVLTGYCGDASFLRALASIVRDCRQHRPQLLYFCDPVLGDNGRYYVAEELRDIYRQELLPLADVITPNAFELSELTGGQPVQTEAQCLRAIAQLHAEAPNLRSVVCTSGLLQKTTAAEEEQQEGMQQPKTMHCYASERRRQQVDPAQSGKKTPAGTSFRLFRFTIPIIGATFVGTGDLFSALLLLWLDETGGQLCASLRATIASMQAVLRRTAAAAAAQQPDSAEPALASPELRLVQSRLDLLQPKADQIEFTELDASSYFE